MARFIWLCLNIVALIRVWKLINTDFDKSSFTAKQKTWLIVICIVFSAKLVLDNFHYGQITIFILLLILQGIKFFEKNKTFFGALLIALGISIKLLPLIIIPYLIFNKQFKEIVLIILLFILFLILPALIIGFEQNNLLLAQWWHLINPINSKNVIDTNEPGLAGLTTLIPTLFMDNVPNNGPYDFRRHVLNLNPQTVGYIINGVRFFLVAFTLYFLRRLPLKRSKLSYMVLGK